MPRNADNCDWCKQFTTHINHHRTLHLCDDCSEEFELAFDPPLSNCCSAPMHGWPETDLCSQCLEHADVQGETK